MITPMRIYIALASIFEWNKTPKVMNANPNIPQHNRATIIPNTISVLCILLHFGFID